MPASSIQSTPQQYLYCRICRNRKQQKSMSIYEGVCLRCFDRFFVHCAVCGAIGYPDYETAARCLSEYRIFQQLDGDWYCSNCHPCTENCDVWSAKPLDISIATYNRIGSKRKFGVEIETSGCRDYRLLRGETVFGAKCDCSITGMEFDSPIMYGDEGLALIEGFCAYADDKGWYANSDCGCHTHYDVRDESDENLYRITYAYSLTSQVWRDAVPASRRDNRFCFEVIHESDVRYAHRMGSKFRRWAGCQQRYSLLNVSAYYRHKTLEVRILEGTVDANEICKWVAIHCRFIDFVKELDFDAQDHFFTLVNLGENTRRDIFTGIIGAELTEWLLNRIKDHRN